MFSVWGIILHVTATGRTKTCLMDLGEKKPKKCLMTAKRDKIVLIIRGSQLKTPVLVVKPFIPKKGLLDIISHLVQQNFPSRCCLCFSNILMSQKYHNIKNKCDPFTKQWAINNNNQVVFLNCICTVYTQRVTFVVYMYTKQESVYFRLAL